MKISLREFQLHASEYISQLPVELTRYGKVIAVLVTPVKIVLTNTPRIISTPEEALKAVGVKKESDLSLSKEKQVEITKTEGFRKYLS